METLVKDLTEKVCRACLMVHSEGAGSTEVWKRKLTTYSGREEKFLEPRRWAPVNSAFKISKVFMVKYHNTEGRN